ncbi:carbamoyl-phosphate synthase large subunit [Limnohabitans sp. MMS-10A-160]|uniref:acetyl/propionyl/methylcrotonyl-CoA carboxylase subunit alpha n=1 Tax=unclassified Limnohabitans TaxID=2626134 RepID=UPI000D38E572|nr:MULTISPECIES: biotin carboxylase N-terminal domain-containing protein [unclassified Limnohabitans]PUE18035.1 carbamoyl-phosphate synthase large subunit [Limnohabitans sp. MMS-10A-192]PUE27263.1 carbamoyl-phosphate synthase large subunit [Limnohabitans sp. MMS-10A-160]
MTSTLSTTLPNKVTRLLIANRGEIARRVIRTARHMGIQTVAVYSDADREALHVQEADTAVALGGTLSADSYLRIDKLLAAAKATGADAVHPGYGFLSENAEFAQAVIDAGLTWVGPPPTAIRALGSKSAAKALAMTHGVPWLPGYFGADQSDATFTAQAQQLGLPLMVKAVAGGGGRGMRLVTDMAQLLPALQSAHSEALAGFGNGDLLMERALLRPRHIEVQIMADAHGHCIHLGERDCSVQRRHQKIIEESPSPAVMPALREQLGQAAIALAQSAGYVGAGTVEFLLDEAQADKPFYLMEMNTRLQVEHPVTEMLTGLDLVEWQLRIARGEPLPLAQADVQLQGHAIEVRLCAEDEHFTPQTGTVQAFAAPEGLRFDHALHAGAVVTPHYDSMLGKLIAHAPTRSEAIDKLCAGLNQTTLLGLPTNRAFLAACLQHPTFAAGEALIPFLAEQADTVRECLQATDDARTVAVLAVLYAQQSPAAAMPCPFKRPVRMGLGEEVLSLRLQELGREQVRIETGDATHEARVQRSDDLLHIALNGKHWQAHAVACTGAVQRWHVQLQGPECFELWLTDQSHSAPSTGASAQAAQSLRAPFNGKLIALHVQEGQSVKQGDAVLVIESMKLEHILCAPRDAVVHSLSASVGQQVGPGQVLVQWKDAA